MTRHSLSRRTLLGAAATSPLVLSGLGGHCQPYNFTGHGLTTWTV